MRGDGYKDAAYIREVGFDSIALRVGGDQIEVFDCFSKWDLKADDLRYESDCAVFYSSDNSNFKMFVACSHLEREVGGYP